MQEEAGSDCWLPMSGHWIIMGEADIMGWSSDLQRGEICSECNLQTLADSKWTNKEPGETSGKKQVIWKMQEIF